MPQTPDRGLSATPLPTVVRDPPGGGRRSATARIGVSTLLLQAARTRKQEHDKPVLGPPQRASARTKFRRSLSRDSGRDARPLLWRPSRSCVQC
jgi:hypothetical protein